jgi:hypothetical protein
MNKTKIQKSETDLQRTIADTVSYLTFLHEQRPVLESLDLKFTFFSDYIDFDNLERPDLLRVLKAFPGRWIKEPNYCGDGLNYGLTEKVSGLTVRCYNGAPPPSCHIEEHTEWITVPARTEKRVTRKVVCNEPQLVDPQLTANSAFNNPAA